MDIKTTVVLDSEKRQKIQTIMAKRDNTFKGGLAKALREAIDDWIAKNEVFVHGG